MAHSEEEVSLTEAAKRLAMTAQAVGQWADKAPAEFVRVRKNRRALLWPGFMVWYRQRLSAGSKPLDLAEAQRRRATAEAEIAEMERDKMRGDLVEKEAVR